MKHWLLILVCGFFVVGQLLGQEENKTLSLEEQNKRLQEKIVALKKQIKKLEAALEKKKDVQKQEGSDSEKVFFFKNFQKGDPNEMILDFDSDHVEFFDENGSIQKIIRGTKGDPNQFFEIEIDAVGPDGKKFKKVKKLDGVIHFDLDMEKVIPGCKEFEFEFSPSENFGMMFPGEFEMTPPGEFDQHIFYSSPDLFLNTLKNMKKRKLPKQKKDKKNKKNKEKDEDCDCDECEEY